LSFSFFNCSNEFFMGFVEFFFLSRGPFSSSNSLFLCNFQFFKSSFNYYLFLNSSLSFSNYFQFFNGFFLYCYFFLE